MNISEAAQLSGINPVTLRYYERVGLIPPIQRSAGGIRNYVQSDIDWIEFIKCMRSAGLPIESLIKYTQLYHEGEETAEERKEILIHEREALLQKREEIDLTLERLEHKIDNYNKYEQKRHIHKKQFVS